MPAPMCRWPDGAAGPTSPPRSTTSDRAMSADARSSRTGAWLLVSSSRLSPAQEHLTATRPCGFPPSAGKFNARESTAHALAMREKWLTLRQPFRPYRYVDQFTERSATDGLHLGASREGSRDVENLHPAEHQSGQDQRRAG